MTGLIKEELVEIVKKKRFIIMMSLAFLGAIIVTILVKTDFWNDLTFFLAMQDYYFYGFNTIVGIALIISVYRLKYTRNSILLTEKHSKKRSAGVIGRIIASVIILVSAYVIMALLTILLSVVFNAGCSADQIYYLILKLTLDCFACIATYTISLFFLYLFAFPIVPVLFFALFMLGLPEYFGFYNLYPYDLYKTALFIVPKVNADIIYTNIMLCNPQIKLFALFILHMAVPTLLSMLVFRLKKLKDPKVKKEKKKKNKNQLQENQSMV